MEFKISLVLDLPLVPVIAMTVSFFDGEPKSIAPKRAME